MQVLKPYQSDPALTGKFKVTVNSPSSVCLDVTHTCGHIVGYGYSGESYARNDGPGKAARICGACANDAIVAKIQQRKLETSS